MLIRTTLDLPAGLVEEAQKMLGFKSKTNTVVLSLRELIWRQRIDELRELLGSVNVDVEHSRRRPVDSYHAS